MLRVTCFALLVTLAVGLELQAKLNGHWEKFKSAHGKKYVGAEEEKRKAVFKKNVEAILMHNLKSDLGEVSYTQGVNEFSDMDHDEFVKVMCGVPIPENYTSNREVMVPTYRDDHPASLDWRVFGAVTSVKNQGSCGSCWTFATVGTVEGTWYRYHRELIELSQQNLLDCTSHNKYGNYGCGGGWPDHAMQYIIDNGGINAESCYPYNGEEGTCSFNRNCKYVTISKFVDIPNGDENALLEAVAHYGPVSVCFNAGGPDFQSYRSGVYDPSYCSQTPNHAVTLVGYGTENGKAYWLIKNSWGESWGDGGYFKLARNKGNMCGITNLASYAIATF